MTSKIIANGILRAVAVLLGIALFLFFIYKIQSVIVYIALAGVISLLGRPVILFFRKRLKFNNTVAVIVVMALFIGVFAGLIGLFIPLVAEQGKNLSLLNLDQLQNNAQNLYLQIQDYFEIRNINVEEAIEESNIIEKIDFSLIPDYLNNILSSLGEFSIGLFSVLFIAFFFLKDSRLFENGILAFVPSGNEIRTKNSMNTIKDLLSRYFGGLLLQILILFVIYTVVLLIFGINNAVVIAFLCALLNLIPYVGPLVSAALMLLLSMSSNIGESFSEVILPKTTYVMIGFVIAQLVDNFFSQPYIFSKSVKSHPLEIFLVIIISGILFGIVGMIIAVPTYTAIKVVLKEFLSENKLVRKLTKDL